MEHHSKPIIYKEMIQYILDSTTYTLKNIAELLNSPISNIRSIYCQNLFPSEFKSEIQLIKLYQIILEVNMGQDNHCFAESAVIHK